MDDTAIQSIATDKEGDLSVSVEPPLKKTRKPSRKVVSDKPPVEGDCTICFENYKSDYAVLKCVSGIFPFCISNSDIYF